MQSIELVAILVATSDLQNFFQGPLRAPQEHSGKLVARSLGNVFAARKTNRLHIYKGFWAKVPGTL